MYVCNSLTSFPSQLSDAFSIAHDSDDLGARLDRYCKQSSLQSQSICTISASDHFAFLFSCRLERRRKRIAKWMPLVGVIS